MTSNGGATNNERLIAAARSDNQEMLHAVIHGGNFDINAQDGLGNTALHYAASQGYLDILEDLLEQDGCDVDPQNRIEKATPLHLALRIEDDELRLAVASSLLDAGADYSIKDKNGETALDLIPQGDTELRAMIRKIEAQSSIARDDVADDDSGDEFVFDGSDD
ncbi:ankyrin [Lenzites betulinus]|nr:ankyrin [Lenzites betulinus]